MCLCASLSVYACIYRCPGRLEEVVASSGSAATGGCKASSVAAGNQTQILMQE